LEIEDYCHWEYDQRMKTDRRELNAIEKAECAALKAEIAARNAISDGRKKLTQEYLAQELGMTQGNLSSHLNGKRPISKEMAAKMAVLLGIPVERFSERLAKEITEMAEAVIPRASSESVGERPGNYPNQFAPSSTQRKYQADLYQAAKPEHRQAVDEIADKMLALTPEQALKLKQAMDLLMPANEPRKD